MTDKLVRFGVAMEGSLLSEFDECVKERGSTRSEVLRDLVRGMVGRERTRKRGKAVGTLTIIYDHHVRDLSDRLTELQHDLGEQVCSTLHVHLDHDHCLEVIVMRGRADSLQDVARQILAIKGVKHGGLELYAGSELERKPKHEHPEAARRRAPRTTKRTRSRGAG